MSEKATFAAGCFWHVEAAFQEIPGVLSTQVGYIGGHKENPTYEEVCTGNTGHAEAVEVTFDPQAVSYDVLLNVFWEIHDPTTLNRQGPDIGHQYRSAVFYHAPEQQAQVNEAILALQASRYAGKPIVTEVKPAPQFYPAEDYHQQYFQKRGLKGLHC